MALADHADIQLLRRAAHAVRDALAKADPSRFGEHHGMGADGTGTEFVDVVAERAIIATLDAAGSDLNILSEEAGRIDRGGSRTLVIDPVDGSTNAIRGIPFYCTSLAIASGEFLSTVDAGFVLNLPTGDEYAAVRGEGATLNGRPIHVPAFEGKDVALATSFGRYASARSLEISGRGGFNIRSLGAAALEICLVAHGAVDVYYFPRDILRVTDIAAAALVLREAGGIVVDNMLVDLDMPVSLGSRVALTAATSRDALVLIEGV